MRHNEVVYTKNRAIKTLKEVPLFSCIDEKIIEKSLFDDSFRFLNLGMGEKIIIHHSIALVVDGFFKIEKSDCKKNAYLKNLGPRDLVGIATLFDENDQYISTLVAKKESEILIVDEKCIKELIKNSPVFSHSLIKLLCTKIRYLNSRIDAYTKTGVEDKLLEYLSHLSKRENDTLCVEMSMSSLSSALGVGRASLYRAVDCLEEKGIIYKDGKKIFLLKEVLL